MKRASIYTVMAVLASPVLAEGNNDPFAKCTFEDGREIVLAHAGDDVVWREDNVDYQTVLLSEQADFRSLFVTLDQTVQRLDVVTVQTVAEHPEFQIGHAQISQTGLGDAVFISRAITGQCVVIIG